MSATNASDYDIVSKELTGIVNQNPLARLALISGGMVQVDESPVFSTEGGQHFLIGKRTADESEWDTPSIDALDTIHPVTVKNEKGCIMRRNKNYGMNDFAKVAAGDSKAVTFYADLAKYNAALNTEQAFMRDLLTALFTPTTGALAKANILFPDLATGFLHNAEESNLKRTDVTTAEMFAGENMGRFSNMIMHSTVFGNSEIKDLTDPIVDPTAVQNFNEMGYTYKGNYGGYKVLLNDRAKSETAGKFNTYLMTNEALYLGYQQALSVRVYYEDRLGGGTEVVQYSLAIAVHCFGTTYVGTEVTDLGGITKTEMATATNWGVRANANVNDIGVVCIRTKG